MAEQKVSRIGIRFGDIFDDDGNINLKFNLVINSERAKKEINEAMALTKNKFANLNYSLLLTFENCKSVQDLSDQFVKLTEEPDESQSEGKPLNEQKLFKKARKILKELNIQTEINENNLYVQLVMKEKTSEKILEPFQILLETGLVDLAKKQNNIEGEVCFKLSSEQIIEKLKISNRLAVPLLTQMKAQIKLNLDKDLSKSLEEIISNVDESLLKTPQFQFLKHFKNFNMDFQFNSAENLPESIKQYILPGKFDTEEHVKLGQESLLNDFLEQIPPNITAQIFVDEFAYLQAKVSAKGFQKLLTEYLNIYLAPLVKDTNN